MLKALVPINVTPAEDTETVIVQATPLDFANNPDIADDAVLLSKVAAKKQISIGDQLYYTINAENTTEDTYSIDVRDDLPNGFKLLDKTVKLTRAGADGNFGTADDVISTVNVSGFDPVKFGSISIASKEKIKISIKASTTKQEQ